MVPAETVQEAEIAPWMVAAEVTKTEVVVEDSEAQVSAVIATEAKAEIATADSVAVEDVALEALAGVVTAIVHLAAEAKEGSEVQASAEIAMADSKEDAVEVDLVETHSNKETTDLEVKVAAEAALTQTEDHSEEEEEEDSGVNKTADSKEEEVVADSEAVTLLVIVILDLAEVAEEVHPIREAGAAIVTKAFQADAVVAALAVITKTTSKEVVVEEVSEIVTGATLVAHAAVAEASEAMTTVVSLEAVDVAALEVIVKMVSKAVADVVVSEGTVTEVSKADEVVADSAEIAKVVSAEEAVAVSEVTAMEVTSEVVAAEALAEIAMVVSAEVEAEEVSVIVTRVTSVARAAVAEASEVMTTEVSQADPAVDAVLAVPLQVETPGVTQLQLTPRVKRRQVATPGVHLTQSPRLLQEEMPGEALRLPLNQVEAEEAPQPVAVGLQPEAGESLLQTRRAKMPGELPLMTRQKTSLLKRQPKKRKQPNLRRLQMRRKSEQLSANLRKRSLF